MAVENGVQNAELGYLLFPFEQYSNLAGKPLVGGHMEIYEAGTDTKYISYQNWDGAENPFRIPIPNDGRITVLADPTKTFDCYLYDSYNNLVCSRLNVQANVPGNISIKGGDTILKNTDGTLDIYLRTLGNNVREYTVNTHNKVLDVQEPLYFVENSNTATVIGFSGDNYVQKDYLNDFVSSSISSKVDVSSFNEEITNITNNITALSSNVDGKMDESKLEFNSHDEISAYNGTAFAGGQGDPEVNDLVHEQSATWNEVTGKADLDDLTAYQTIEGMSAYQLSGDYATHDDLTAYQPSGDYATHDDLTAYQTVDGMSAYQPSGDYATHDDLTAYQPSGDYAYASAVSAAITGSQSVALQISGGYGNGLQIDGGASVYVGPGGHINVSNGANLNLNNGGIVNVADGSEINLSSFANISGTSAGITASDWVTSGGIRLSDMTAYQPASGMTAYQPTGDYATHDDLTAYATTSVVSSVSSELYSAISGISGTYELSAGSGIDITDYPNEQKTVISVTAEGGNKEVENLVIAQSATWDSVTGKANADDLTAYQTVDGMSAYQPVGDYYSASNPDGFLVADDITGKIDITAMTAYQSAGDYLSANALDNLSGTWETVTAKANADDLTAYQTIEGMTAYQPSGDYQPAGSYLSANALDNVSANWNEVSAKLDTTAFSDVSGSFLTEVPDTYLQNTDLTIVDNKITEISGVPLSAGDELPSGVMNTSALEYNAVNEISGYNGSAIAQYGAEKQWLQHDDTLVHAANSAQYALGVNLSAVAQLLGVDETVLWSGELSVGQTAALTENYSAFRKLEFKYRPWSTADNGQMKYEQFGTEYRNWQTLAGWMKNNLKAVFIGAYSATDGNHITLTSACFNNITATNAWANAADNYRLFEIIGIGRKEV